jgi:acetylglutamate kinase
MTRFLEERGIESRFVNGLRVTTPAIVDAVLKVFAGTVNHQLVAALVAAGARPVGLTGLDAALAVAEQLDAALGAVGRVVKTNPEILDLLTDGGYLPVVACIGGGPRGEIFNVNADQMAVACATGFRAERLFFLTDVEGVRDGSGSTVASLTPGAIESLIAAGIAIGGMQAKLEAAKWALASGVGEIAIAPGRERGILGRLIAGENVGTRVVETEEVAR